MSMYIQDIKELRKVMAWRNVMDYMKKYDGYGDCFVAFIDILGFKNYIINSNFDNANKLFVDIKRFADLLLKNPNGHFTEEQFNKVVVNIISDSIVISIPRNVDESLEILLLVVNTVIFNIMLNHDLTCRGGIADGAFCTKEGIAFGPALVEAYNLENTVAVYPRIVFTQNICNMYRDISFGDLDRLSDLIILDDTEYLYIVDYFGFAIRRIANDVFYNVMAAPYAEAIFRKISCTIKDNLAHSTDKRIREKYIYLANYYNESLSRIKKLGELPFNCEPITNLDLGQMGIFF